MFLNTTKSHGITARNRATPYRQPPPKRRPAGPVNAASSSVVKGGSARDVLVDERHGTDRDVVPDPQSVCDDATIGAYADIVPNDQIVTVQPQGLNTNRGVLTDEKVTTDFDVASDHYARQVSDAKAGPYLGIDTDIDAVFEVELAFQSLGVNPRKTISRIKILGQSKHE